MKHLTIFLAAVFTLQIGIADSAHAKKLVPVDSDPSPAPGLVVTVRDENRPLKGAHVWVETLDGKLLAEGETSEEGRFIGEVPDAALASGVSVTASAPGHGAVSFLENVAHRVTLELPLAPVDSYSILNGKLTGFKDNDDETRAMAGLVAKAMEITDLVQLDSSSFISPLKDTIDIFGSRQIPSNLVLPDQTFPIYFIPIHVNKPNYRLPVLQGSSSRYFGVSGTVDVQEAISAIRNGSAWDIVNLLEFNKVGVTRPVPVASGGQNIRLDVNMDTAIRESIRLKPGRNTTTGDASRRLAVSLWQPYEGIFVPTDVKQVLTDDLQLTTVENRSARVMDVLVSEKGDHFRGAWLRTNANSLPDAGLTADLMMTGLENTWTIRGGETAQLVIAHVETYEKTSIGSSRYVDKWVLVGPRKTQLKLPTVAMAGMRRELGKISHVSVDLLQMGLGSYPFFLGENASNDLSVLEKVRREIH